MTLEQAKQKVLAVYPYATLHEIRINNWGTSYIVGKTDKPFMMCESDDDFMSATTTPFYTPDEAWQSAADNLPTDTNEIMHIATV